MRSEHLRNGNLRGDKLPSTGIGVRLRWRSPRAHWQGEDCESWIVRGELAGQGHRALARLLRRLRLRESRLRSAARSRRAYDLSGEHSRRRALAGNVNDRCRQNWRFTFVSAGNFLPTGEYSYDERWAP